MATEYKITALPPLLAINALDTDVIAIVNVLGDITNKMEVSELRTLMVTTTAVTSAGALMDSELTSIADVKALNQSVISGAAPVFDATNFTNLPSASPAGSDTQIQFNNAGAFGASENFTYDGTDLAIYKSGALSSIVSAETDTNAMMLVLEKYKLLGVKYGGYIRSDGSANKVVIGNYNNDIDYPVLEFDRGTNIANFLGEINGTINTTDGTITASNSAFPVINGIRTTAATTGAGAAIQLKRKTSQSTMGDTFGGGFVVSIGSSVVDTAYLGGYYASRYGADDKGKLEFRLNAGNGVTGALDVKAVLTWEGYWGQGTETPTALSHLVNSVATTVAQKIDLANAQTANAFEINSYGGSGGDLVGIDATGLVGIGTTTPLQLLHAEKNQNAFTVGLIKNTTSGTGARSGVIVESNSGNLAFIERTSAAFTSVPAWQNAGVMGTNAGSWWIAAYGGSGDIRFQTGGYAASNERMQIDSAGLVAIGNTSPSAQFHTTVGLAATVGQKIDLANAQTANAFEINSFGGSGGDLLEVDKDGKITSAADTINIATKTPASASATGTQGDIAWDSSYIYVCVATDTWERSAIATW